jgi:radical SAM protein with 4Fe4S-binding SPASM domain
MAAWKQWKGNNYVARIKSNFCNADNDAHVVIQPDGYITKCEHYTDSHHIGHISREGFDEAPRARFKKRGTKLMEACEHCVRYPDCFFLLSCPNYRECYAEMPEMYEHMLQQDMKAMYQDYLEKGVTNR